MRRAEVPSGSADELPVKPFDLTTEEASDRNWVLVERRTGHPRSRPIRVALWLLVMGLALAPSLALAAAACAPACCPAEAEHEAERGDCGSGFDRRGCCEMAPAPFEAFAQGPVEMPAPPALPVRITAAAPPEHVDLRARFVPAQIALATSPLRFSVVLRI